MNRVQATMSAIAVLLSLVGCQAKITERIDAKLDGSAVVHAIVDMDDQFYGVASQQKGGSFEDSFKASEGWQVVKTYVNGHHIVTATKAVPAGSLDSWFKLGATPGQPTGFMSNAAPTLDIQKGLFTDTYTLTAHVPPITPPSASTSGSDAQFGQAAATMMSSMFNFNLQLALPGKLVSTNGEIQPDGAVNWVIGMQSPTDISLVVSEPDYPHILIAVALGCLAIVVVVAVVLRGRQRRVATHRPHQR